MTYNKCRRTINDHSRLWIFFITLQAMSKVTYRLENFSHKSVIPTLNVKTKILKNKVLNLFTHDFFFLDEKTVSEVKC